MKASRDPTNPSACHRVRGEWGPGFNAQNPMIDEFMEEYDLEDQDWRPAKPWYEK